MASDVSCAPAALMWEYCGMSRTAEGLKHALSRIPELREQFWRDVKVLGSGEELNQSLEKAGGWPTSSS